MKKSSTSFRCSSLLFFFFIIAASTNVVYSDDVASIGVDSGDATCTYDLTVVTGTEAEAGTDSIISVTLGNSAGKRIDIQNLKDSGTMQPPSHDYFEKGNVDSFRLTSLCFDTAVCNITVTSDGSGTKPGWFLERVEVSYLEPVESISTVINFMFNQWLANDEPPYKLTASASINGCQSSTS